MKTKHVKIFIALFTLALAVFVSACGSSQNTQTRTYKPSETSTPYKPLKRVSKDVIKSETKAETVKVEAKK